MTDILHQKEGTIDKYEGDAIIAFWNAPLEVEDHAAKCVLAARLESANKQFGTYTMVSEETYALIPSAFSFRELSRIAVKGRKQAVRVFEPMFFETYEANSTIYTTFKQGLDLYYRGQFKQAATLFSSIEDKDPAARAYGRICRQLENNPPRDWDGFWVMTQK